MIYTTSLSFPNIFSTISGKTMLDTTFEAINKRLLLLVQSAYLELFGDPDFGCGIYEITFDYATDITFDLLKKMISESIEKYEPSIYVSTDMINVSINNKNNHIEITINYIVRDSDMSGSATMNMDLGVSE